MPLRRRGRTAEDPADDTDGSGPMESSCPIAAAAAAAAAALSSCSDLDESADVRAPLVAEDDDESVSSDGSGVVGVTDRPDASSGTGVRCRAPRKRTRPTTHVSHVHGGCRGGGGMGRGIRETVLPVAVECIELRSSARRGDQPRKMPLRGDPGGSRAALAETVAGSAGATIVVGVAVSCAPGTSFVMTPKRELASGMPAVRVTLRRRGLRTEALRPVPMRTASCERFIGQELAMSELRAMNGSRLTIKYYRSGRHRVAPRGEGGWRGHRHQGRHQQRRRVDEPASRVLRRRVGGL